MFTIKATVRYIKRVKIVCPQDGVHRVGKDGHIKGVHSLWFDDKLIPKGQTAFYWQLDNKEGIRVGYSFGWLTPISHHIRDKEYKIMMKCYGLGISPKPHDTIDVKLRLYYDHENRNIRCIAPGIKVQHVNYDKEAWKKYAEGYPYDWACDNHADHNPNGFNRFVVEAKEKAGNLIGTSWKLGDVLWCCTNKRWYLVDIGK